MHGISMVFSWDCWMISLNHVGNYPVYPFIICGHWIVDQHNYTPSGKRLHYYMEHHHKLHGKTHYKFYKQSFPMAMLSPYIYRWFTQREHFHRLAPRGCRKGQVTLTLTMPATTWVLSCGYGIGSGVTDEYTQSWWFHVGKDYPVVI